MTAAKQQSLGVALADLRRPFTAAAIRVKPQTVTKDKTKGLVTYYIDARLVVERLNEVVGPEGWSDSYKLLCEGALAPGVGVPVECSLTVLGVTKADVGQISPGAMDDKGWKSAYSDAFKRAGVKFSIGAYLYGGANVWAPVQVGADGKVRGFTNEGIVFARDRYADWIALPRMLELYGEPVDHGDSHEDLPEEPKADAGVLVAPPVSQADRGVEPASSGEHNGEASFDQKGRITLLIGQAAKAHKTTQPKLKAALVTDYGRLEDITAVQADELIAKLSRWVENAPVPA